MRITIQFLVAVSFLLTTAFASDEAEAIKRTHTMTPELKKQADMLYSVFVYQNTPIETKRNMLTGLIALSEHDAKLKNALAFSLLNGQDGITDKIQGLKLLTEASESGYLPALGNLGFYYLTETTEREKGWHILRKAAKKGDVQACSNLGYLLALENDNPTEDEFAEGYGYIETAAAAGNITSIFHRGLIRLATPDEATQSNFIEDFSVAAKAEHPQAMVALGDCLIKGRGIIQDISEGLTLIKRSISMGLAEAQSYYDLLCTQVFLESLDDLNPHDCWAALKTQTENAQRVYLDKQPKERKSAILKVKISEKTRSHRYSASTATIPQRPTHDQIVARIKKHIKERDEKIAREKIASEERQKKREADYMERLTRHQELTSTQQSTSSNTYTIDNNKDKSYSTKEAHIAANEQLAAEEKRKTKHTDRPKGKVRTNPAPVFQQETKAEQAPLIHIGSTAYSVFEKLWVMKTSNGTGDETQYTNDRVKISRDEVQHLVTSLGGVYNTSRGKGSHEVAQLDKALNEDTIHIGTECVDISDVRGAITLPRNDGNLLKPYNIAQLRHLLIKLGYTKNTVQRMNEVIEKEMGAASNPTTTKSKVIAKAKSKGKKKK